MLAFKRLTTKSYSEVPEERILKGIVQNKDWTCGLVDLWTRGLFFSIFY